MKNDFELRLSPIQQRIFLCKKRHMLVISGFSGGKTFLFQWLAILFALKHPDCLVWLVGPDYPLAAQSFIEMAGIVEQLRQVRDVNQSKHIITLRNGSMIQLKSAERPNRTLRAGHPDFVLADEVSLYSPEAYDKLVARISAHHAQLIMGCNVPEGKDWGFDWVRSAYSDMAIEDDSAMFCYPTWENTMQFPGGRQDPEIIRMEQKMSPVAFARYVGADMAVMTGLVYPEFDLTRHVVEGYRPDKCCVSIDPAYSGVASIHWYDWDGNTLTAFDEVYSSGLADPDIVDIVKGHGVIPYFAMYDSEDPGLGELLIRAGINAIPANKGSVHSGIMLVKSWLHADRIRVSKACPHMGKEFSGYTFHGNSEVPVKKNDHAMDELRYLVTTLAETERRQREQQEEIDSTIRIAMPRIRMG